MRPTQKDINPYKNSDSNKRYYTYDYYLRQTFGGKCIKIPLDCGFTCPNIDGVCGIGGCIFCSSRGSGDFAASSSLSLSAQYAETKEKLGTKWKTDKCIPYLQAHTNTYAPVEILRSVYEEAISLPGAVGLNIATRADTLPDDVISLLADIANRTVLTVELGLQSVHDKTARLINRGHTFDIFKDGYNRLRRASDKINICVHLINGLPGEDKEMMCESARALSSLMPDQVKLHLLYVLRETPLADMYHRGEYVPMTAGEYTDVVCSQLELLPPDTVIGRITGDGIADELLAPEWSRKKLIVMNSIDRELFRRDSYQGKLYNGGEHPLNATFSKKLLH